MTNGYYNPQDFALSNQNTASAITPGGMFSKRQTRAATNQAIAGAQSGASAYELRKQLERPGSSFGAGTYRNMLPAIMQSRAMAAQAAADTPFNDAAANARQMLAGQSAQDQEGQGWYGIGQDQYQENVQNNNRNQARGMSLLAALLNGTL